MVPGNGGRTLSINVFMLIVNVLAVHLPWITPKWTQIFNILSSKTDRNITNVAVCNRAGDMGKIQWASWSDLQPFCRHRKLQCLYSKLIYHMTRRSLNMNVFTGFFSHRTFKHFSTFRVQCTCFTWLCWYWKHTVNYGRCRFSVRFSRNEVEHFHFLNKSLFFSADMRLKFLTLLMIFVVSITIVLAMGRFGFGVLEDNFVASLNTTYKSSAQFMCFYGLLNFYLFTMAYVYSPSGRPVHGKCKQKLFRQWQVYIESGSFQKRASPKIIQHFPWSTTQMKMSFMVQKMRAGVHWIVLLGRETIMIATKYIFLF